MLNDLERRSCLISWSTVSKEAERSNNARKAKLFLSMASTMIFRTTSTFTYHSHPISHSSSIQPTLSIVINSSLTLRHTSSLFHSPPPLNSYTFITYLTTFLTGQLWAFETGVTTQGYTNTQRIDAFCGRYIKSFIYLQLTQNVIRVQNLLYRSLWM